MLIIRTGRGRVSVLRSCQPICRFLFLDHVKTVGSFVSKKGKIPLIWDDMLRNMPRSDIQNSGIGSLVEVMVWSYTEDIDRYLLAMVLVVQLISIDRFLGHDTWRMYAQLFRGVWAASAFKVGNMI